MSPSAVGGYVSGGRDFQGAFHAALHPLPSRYANKPDSHSPKLAMIDREHQGASAVVRAIGEGIFGTSDPACIDADAYSGMTDQELIAHELTRAEVDAIATSHGCVPKRIYR